ncbi:uncharacterized protein LOC113127560 isoform X2 [Mastacembelus armatus]|uniref:uncharacterized protein LOC113127560 isoform X2 n=1 Tax=Mastacembelus armatus TaxID=205130 RepID=UPI000E45DBD3|nr:uncharacterized protein LOC113127560 isoform X2 [Mastacembelus armatus]
MYILLSVFLCVVSAQKEILLYKKVGDDVVLSPVSLTDPISILWKEGPHIAAQWEKPEPQITYFRQFKERSVLNISSGELTIRALVANDSNLYTAVINGQTNTIIKLSVISPVPVPAVDLLCDTEKLVCTFICDGGPIADMEPVTYEWMLDGKVKATSNQLNVTKETYSSKLICEIKNPISKESSQPIPNPFIPNPPGSDDPKITAGVVVFICLLSAVLLLVFTHRCKSGMWFFQKASMPWEAEFWKNTQRSRTGSNGTAAHKGEEQTDEETPMT